MVIAVGEPNLAKDILTDPLTIKSPAFYKSLDDATFGIPSIFTRSDEYWHSRRKGVAPAFSSKHVKRMNEVASKKVDEWIQNKLSKFVDSGEAFDVGKEMIDIALSAISETAFEYQMSMDEKENFLSDLDLLKKEFTFKSSLNPLRKPFGLFFAERRVRND